MNEIAPMSTLLYGPPGSGKSALAVSSFWDWKQQTQVANGRLITFGREDNPALRVPEELRQTASGISLRLGSPSLNDVRWVATFRAVVDAMLAQARKGEHLDFLIIDGMSEFDLLYESTFDNLNKDAGKFAKWDALLSEMFAIMQRLDPVALNCHVIVTARVMERRKERSSAQSTISGDPEFMDFDYYPAIRGSFRQHFPHYFNLVLYMQEEQRLVREGPYKGTNLSVHLANMVRTGNFYVKNQWKHEWIQSGKPLQLINTSFPNLLNELSQVADLVGTPEIVKPEDFIQDSSVVLTQEEVTA